MGVAAWGAASGVMNWYHFVYVKSPMLLVVWLVVFVVLWGAARAWAVRRVPVAWFALVVLLFGAWLWVVGYYTWFSRLEGGDGADRGWFPLFHSWVMFFGGQEEKFRESFMNGYLYVPGGLWLADILLGWGRVRRRFFQVSARRRAWTEAKWFVLACVAVGMFLLSFGIELGQFWSGRGFAEADDVLHNVLGGVTGGVLCVVLERLCGNH